MANSMQVKVPDIGGYKDVPIIEILVAVGDRVDAEQPLMVLESDKATMEVPAPAAGTISAISVKLGDRLAEGSVICELLLDGAGASAAPTPAVAPAAAAAVAPAAAVAAPVAAAPVAAASSEVAVVVPDIGDYKDVPVIEVLVADGDTVDKDQPLMVLESDKATMEVPAPAAGVIKGFVLKVGDRVSPGTAVCRLLVQGAAVAAPAPASAAPAAAPVVAAVPAAAAVAPVSAAPLSQTVTVPDIGDYKGVPVIEVLVANGDRVDKDQPLMVLESDKATMEVPAPASGIVSDFRLKVGDSVAKGDVVCQLTGAGVSVPAPAPALAPAPLAPAPAVAAAPVAPVVAAAPPAASGVLPHAGPATRKFARELGVDLQRVTGSARHGRITIEDVQAYVKQTLKAPPPVAVAAAPAGGMGIPPIPAQDFSKFGAVETVALARIRKLSAAHLHRCWLNVPHVTQTDEADITELEAFRKTMSDELVKLAGGPKLTLLPFIMMACATAMKVYPEFNSSLTPDGESLVMKKYCHIGFAADTPNGLVVPVVRDVWSKGLKDLAAETAELAKKARDGKLKPADMSGGCFSISSLGGIGGSHFTPIVNAPEVGILGVSRSQMKPVWDGKAFQPRLMVPLSLSYDHRVIDGAYAARFIVLLGQLLGDVRRLIL